MPSDNGEIRLKSVRLDNKIISFLSFARKNTSKSVNDHFTKLESDSRAVILTNLQNSGKETSLHGCIANMQFRNCEKRGISTAETSHS